MTTECWIPALRRLCQRLNAPVRKYEVLGDIPNFEDRQTLDGHQKHRKASATGKVRGEKDGNWSTHMAARDLVVFGKGGREALELFYRTLIMGNESGEAQHFRRELRSQVVQTAGVVVLLKANLAIEQHQLHWPALSFERTRHVVSYTRAKGVRADYSRLAVSPHGRQQLHIAMGQLLDISRRAEQAVRARDAQARAIHP